jgi:hypothetical protein
MGMAADAAIDARMLFSLIVSFPAAMVTNPCH